MMDVMGHANITRDVIGCIKGDDIFKLTDKLSILKYKYEKKYGEINMYKSIRIMYKSAKADTNQKPLKWTNDVWFKRHNELF